MNNQAKTTTCQLETTDKAKDVALTLSKKAGTYWRGESDKQEIHEKLCKKLVPAKGDAKTVHGKLLRASTRIYNDLYGNGGGNMVNDIHEDQLAEEGEDGYKKPEFALDVWFKGFFDDLKTWLPAEHQACLAKVNKLVLEENVKFDIAFDHLQDRVIHTVLTTHNIKP